VTATGRINPARLLAALAQLQSAKCRARQCALLRPGLRRAMALLPNQAGVDVATAVAAHCLALLAQAPAAGA